MVSNGGLSYARAADGAHLAFEVVGTGLNPVLFAPGGSTSLEDCAFLRWREPRIASELSQGSSGSTSAASDAQTPLPSGRRQTLEERAADLISVMDAVDLESAALFATPSGDHSYR